MKIVHLGTVHQLYLHRRTRRTWREKG